MEKMEETLNDQIGNTLQDKNEQLIEREKVPGTPFEIITTEQGSFIALGNYRISNQGETKNDLKIMIYDMNYEFLINVMFAIIDMSDKMKVQTIVKQ